jgi:hypothetical protein
MSCSLTQNLPLGCRNSEGGIKSVFVTSYENTATLTTSGGTVLTFTLTPGSQFFQYSLRKQTGSLTQTTTINDENGTVYYAPSVVFTLIQLQANTRSELALLAQNDLMVIVLDNNGSYWLVGSDKGLQMTTGSSDTGTKFSDLNGYKVTIANGGESYPMLQVPSSLIASLTTPAA